ncbi:MAG: hypothetical protein AB7D05_05045 [Mangrovibacterium sp.]
MNCYTDPYRDEVFQHACFYTPQEIGRMLSRFGTVQMREGIYYSPEFELLDGTGKQELVEPAFLATMVQKKK